MTGTLKESQLKPLIEGLMDLLKPTRERGSIGRNTMTEDLTRLLAKAITGINDAVAVILRCIFCCLP
jgi:hypothetical protein